MKHHSSKIAGNSSTAARHADSRSQFAHILVVADDLDLRAQVDSLLAPYYRVTAVEYGSSAITAANGDAPKLILVEVRLSESNGFDLMAALRLDSQTASIPVLLLSASGGRDSWNGGPNADRSDVVDPFDNQELLGRIGACLATSLPGNGVSEREFALRTEAETLNELAFDLTAELDLQTLLQKVTDAGTRLTGAHFGAFFYNSVNDQGETYLLYTLSGAPREAFEKFGMPRNTPLFEPTFRGDGVVRIDDVLKDMRYGHNPPHHGMPQGHLPVRSYLAVPVVSRTGTVLGGLFFGHPDQGVFTDRAERLALGIAAQAAVAIENARLFEQAQREMDVRKRAEAALRDSEQRYRQLMESLPAAVYMCDAEGHVTLFNQAAVELWGREPVVGEDRWSGAWQIYRPDGTPLTPGHTPMAVALREGRPVRDLEVVVVRPDGSRRNVLPHPELLHDSSGKVVGAVNMLLDVTELKRAEQLVREQNARINAVVNSVIDAIITICLDGTIESVNDATEQMFGYTAEEMIGRNISMLMPPPFREEHNQYLRSYLDTGVAKIIGIGREAMAVRKDGRVFPIDLAVTEVKLGNRRLFTGVVRDISERKGAELALRDSETRFRTLAENAPVAIFIKDLDGRYTLANPLASQALGCSGGAAGFTDHDLLPADVADRLRERDLEIISSGISGERVEIVQRDGFHGEYLSVKFPLVDAEGRAIGVCGVATDITERNRAQEALRESQARFVRFMEHLPGLAWIKDAAGKYVYANDAASNAFQIPTKDLYGKTDADVFRPDTAEQFQQNDQRALTSDAGIQTVETLEQEDGAIHFSLVNKFPIPGPEGTATLVGGMAFDITDRMQAEQALRESEERFRTLASHAPVGIFMSKPDGGTVFVNESWCAMTGLTTEQACGRGWVRAVHPGDRERVVAGWETAVGNGDASNSEFRFLRPDGVITWLQGNAVPLRDSDGRVAGYIGTVMDITERKQAEESLRTSEQIYRAIGESNDYGVWICDPGGNNVYASESFLKLVGLSQQECAGFGWTKALHPDDIERTSAAWAECVNKGGIWDIEHRFRGADGQWHPILARGVPVKNESGEITAWAGINLDISRLKRVEEELREADRRKDEFLAVLAHELRNPLAPIRTGLELMRLAGDDRILIEEVRTTMERQTLQMVRLIDDLLDVSRITRGTVDLRKCRVELATVIQSALETARPVMDELKHRLTVSIPNQPIVLDADATRLAQVISNLLNNAAKYMKPGGNIELAAERQGQSAIVSVKDAGVGIPAEMLDRIFDMFAQVDRSLERSHGGLGIGLTLVQRLVQMHGGTVEARSAGPNQGSEFVVRLPVAAGPLQDDQVEDSGCEIHTGKRRILVADDNENAAKLLAMLLRALGNEVRIAFDGEAAIAVASEFAPDVALLDLGMPKLDGYETARRIRSQTWGKGMVLAAVTGWGQDDDKRQTKEAGFDHHLVKPVDAATLRALLAD
jgi:PAS domain S-box-containing protein